MDPATLQRRTALISSTLRIRITEAGKLVVRHPLMSATRDGRLQLAMDSLIAVSRVLHHPAFVFPLLITDDHAMQFFGGDPSLAASSFKLRPDLLTVEVRHRNLAVMALQGLSVGEVRDTVLRASYLMAHNITEPTCDGQAAGV